MFQKESYKKIENRKQKKDTCYKKIFHEYRNSSKVEAIERKKKDKNNQYLHILNKTN